MLLTFFNKFTKELEFATKSSVGKPMNDNAKALFSAEQIAIISEFCKGQNATCLWEVISKKDDKHPIVYDDEAVFYSMSWKMWSKSGFWITNLLTFWAVLLGEL